mgnify:FL=1
MAAKNNSPINATQNTPTPHNAAKKGQIAKTVLMPGDPERAEWIAKTFLTGAKMVTDVRGMKGFTGKFNSKPVTVMGSGMGAGSAGIYMYELYNFYGVEAIIRIGTCGSLQKEVKAGDMIFAITASTDTNYEYQYGLEGHFSPAANFELLQKAAAFAEEKKYRFHVGPIFSSDFFSKYNAMGDKAWKSWARMGALAQDMETYCLYCQAAYAKKKAFSIITSTFNKVTNAQVPLDAKTLTPMVQTALSLV